MKKRVKKKEIKRKDIKHFTYAFVLLNLIIIFLFFDNPQIAAGLLIAIGIWGLLIWNSKRTLFAFLFGLIFGIIAEIITVNIGILEYSFTTFLGIPLWISCFLGNFSAFVYQKTKEFREGKIE